MVPAMVAVMIFGCSGDEGITYSMNDVSSRISGFSSSAPGQGAALVVTGSELDGIIRVFVGDVVVTKENFVSQEPTSLTFIVPPNATLGENELLFVWSGPARAFASIDVVKFHTISAVLPNAAGTGQTVTLKGANLDLVEDIDVNGTPVTSIVSQEQGTLRFTMPAGATTGPVTVSSAAGSYPSPSNLIACDSEPGNLACRAVINTNGSFEDSPLGAASGLSGWGGLTGARITGVITDEEAFEGLHSVKVTINEVGANPWDIQPTSSFPVVLDDQYHLSVMVKGTGIANMKFAVDGDASGGYAEYGNPQIAITSNQWQEVSYYFTPTSASGNNGTVRFAISMSYPGNVGGVIYMDNLRVVKVE